MRSSGPFLALVILGLLSLDAMAADPAMVAFCVGKAPDAPEMRAWHEANCPAILSDALSTADDTAAATQKAAELTAAKTKAEIEKAQIDNAKALLPATTAPAAPTAPADKSLDALGHLAMYGQATILNSAVRQVGADIKEKLNVGTLVVTKLQLDELTNTAIDPRIIKDELKVFTDLATKWQQDWTGAKCPIPKPGVKKPITTYSFGWEVAPSAVESIFMTIGRIAAMFQTTLLGAAPANLPSGQETMIHAALVQALPEDTGNEKNFRKNIFLAIPPLTPENSVLLALASLRAETTKIATTIGTQAEDSACAKTGKALLEVIGKRLEALNTTPANGISPMALALRRAALTDQVGGKARIEQYLLLSADHTAGSFASIKRGLRSPEYVQNATVVVSYRLQKLDGTVRDAGVRICEVNRKRYDRLIIVDPTDATPATCKPVTL